MKPAAAFAVPIASSSCGARTCWLCFPANERAVRISSANETRKTPTAAGKRRMTSCQAGCGTAKLGSPAGIAPTTATPCACRSNAHETPMAATTTTSAAGALGMKTRSANSAASAAAASATVVPLMWFRSCRTSQSCEQRVAGIDRETSELPELADDQDDCDAMDVAQSTPDGRSSRRSSPSAAPRQARSTPRRAVRASRQAQPRYRWLTLRGAGLPRRRGSRPILPRACKTHPHGVRLERSSRATLAARGGKVGLGARSRSSELES